DHLELEIPPALALDAGVLPVDHLGLRPGFLRHPMVFGHRPCPALGTTGFPASAAVIHRHGARYGMPDAISDQRTDRPALRAHAGPFAVLDHLVSLRLLDHQSFYHPL